MLGLASSGLEPVAGVLEFCGPRGRAVQEVGGRCSLGSKILFCPQGMWGRSAYKCRLMAHTADLNTRVLRDEDSHHSQFLSILQGVKLSHSMFGLHSFENTEEHGCQTPADFVHTLQGSSRFSDAVVLSLHSYCAFSS